MRRTQVRDTLLLATLVPLWVVCTVLHVREVLRTGLAMPPVFASPPASADDYPTLGGFHLERESGGTGLQPGDRLLRLGDVDLRGVGPVGFSAYAVDQAGPDLRAPLWIERDGRRLERVLELRPLAIPWFRVPFVLATGSLATLVFLRSRRTAQSALGFAGFLCIAAAMAPFPGGSWLQTWVAWPAFYLGVPIAITLLLLWATGVPEQMDPDQRLSPAWALALGGVHLTTRLAYPLGGPLPSTWIPIAEHAADALVIVGLTAIVTWNYAHAGREGRRRLRWLLYGFYLAGVPLVVLLSLPLLEPDFASFEELLGWFGILGVASVLGIAVAVARFGLFEIDRLVSATATATIVGVTLLAGVLALGPRLADLLSDRIGVGHQSAELLFAFGLAAMAVPAYRRLRVHIEGVLAPGRRAIAERSERLLHDLATCETPAQVTGRVGARLAEVMGARSAGLYVRGARGDGPGEALVCEMPGPDSLQLPPDSPLLRSLRPGTAPADLGRLPAGAPERSALAPADAALLVPLRSGDTLTALVALGPRTSGDAYDAADLAVLGTIAEKASARLLRLRAARTLRSEQQRVEQLRAEKDQAEQANLAKSRFLAAASHDLRQPLHALGIFVDALHDRMKSGENAELGGRIVSLTQSLTDMFDSLLDMSRIDAGRVRADVTEFELGPLLERLCTELAPLAERKGLALRFVPTRLAVRSDPLLLGRILRNLLVNAIRYTDRGRVLAGARRRAGAVRVEVWDTGSGIPESRRREIFQEFVQLERGERRGGLGLGLSIVERLARLLDHGLELRSVPGRGSVFAVELPRVQTAPAPAPAVPRRGADLAGRTVLVVDDDPAIRAGMRDLLERWRVRVLAADGVEAALAQLSPGNGPDVVLADYRLGDERTGLEAIHAVRAAVGAEVPAAVISGETGPEVLEAIRASGFPRLAKPVPPARLRAVLASLLGAS